MGNHNFYLSVLKPTMDWVSALAIFLLVSPFFLLLSLTLIFHFKGNPFYIHKRIGKWEQPFFLIKFRSMKINESEESISGLGRFMRATSLDELPQLINVLKLEMSLVGPRPLLVEYLPYYNQKEKQRHNVKPGITGLAQVNGRNSIDWKKRMEYDVTYVQRVSFTFDLKIIFKTFIELLKFDKTSYRQGQTIKFSDYAKNR